MVLVIYRFQSSSFYKDVQYPYLIFFHLQELKNGKGPEIVSKFPKSQFFIYPLDLYTG